MENLDESSSKFKTVVNLKKNAIYEGIIKAVTIYESLQDKNQQEFMASILME